MLQLVALAAPAIFLTRRVSLGVPISGFLTEEMLGVPKGRKFEGAIGARVRVQVPLGSSLMVLAEAYSGEVALDSQTHWSPGLTTVPTLRL